jgi:hypothetical protein
MIRSLTLLAATVWLVTPATAQEKKDAKDDGWGQLFNGKDFTGWKLPDPPSGQFKGMKEVKDKDGKVTEFIGVGKDDKEVTLWKIKDGVIVGGGPMSHLYTETEADDFHLRVEVMINDKGNSGIFFRAGMRPGVPKGYEAQVNATGGDPIKSGCLYPNGEFKLDKFKKEICLVMDKATHKPDEFFVEEVIAVGDEITIKVNDKETLKWKDPNKTFTKGHFAIQGHDPGSVMTFKKVEYKAIKK